jgi:hypothetical protein
MTRDSHHRPSDPRRSPPPEVETKVIRCKEPTREAEDREVDDLMKRMRGLSVHEEAYAVLFVRCALRFPSVAQVLPKPVFARHTPAPTPAMTFSIQTPAPPTPARHLWPVAANIHPSPVPQPASDPASFFRPRTSQPSHRVRERSTAQEYMRSARALVLDDQLYLPSAQA